MADPVHAVMHPQQRAALYPLLDLLSADAGASERGPGDYTVRFVRDLCECSFDSPVQWLHCNQKAALLPTSPPLR